MEKFQVFNKKKSWLKWIYSCLYGYFFLAHCVVLLAELSSSTENRLHHGKREPRKLSKKKRSMSSLYGRITEQFAPFMEEYPFDSKKFRFIGSPIDGIQFEEDGIYFIEFKAAGSVLTLQQKKIKELIERKKVGWHVFEVKNGG